MSVKVSIVVPVYNVEKYLDRCVQSLVDQTYTNIEILLVDDGAKDSSGEMCDAWALKDDRIRVIHKPNGGLSDARNVGAEHAIGDYIGFIDSDDYAAADMYESLVALIEENDADIAICGVADVYADHVDNPSEIYTKVMTPEEVLSDIFLNKTLMVGVPPRLYPAWLIAQVPSPVGKTHEDACIVVDLFSRVKRVAVDTTPRYFYCHNEGTITSSPSVRALHDNIDAWERNRKLVEQTYPAIVQDVLFRCYWAHFDVLDGMMLSDDTDPAKMQEVIDYLLQHKKDILAHPDVNTNRKIAIRCLAISKALYRLLVVIQHKRQNLNA